MADKGTILIVEARFYEAIADDLARGARAALDAAGFASERLPVTGVFEIPAAIRLAMASDRPYVGYLAIGCVIRGETDHYDHICREASRALMTITTEHGAALGFGVLTCETRAQAEERADPAGRDKGAEAAHACLRMIELQQHFSVRATPGKEPS